MCRAQISSLVAAVLATGFFFFLQLPTAKAATSLRGEIRTCRDYADLDYALDHPNSNYFKGWTSSDFDAAESWVTSCFASPPTKQDIERQSLLVRRRADLEARGDIQKNDETINAMHEAALQEQRDKEEQQRAEEAEKAAEQARVLAEVQAKEAMRRAEETRERADRQAKEQARRTEEANALAARQARQAALDECQRSSGYQRYAAQSHILSALDRESEAQEALDHERRVEEASGTENLYLKRIAGESLVTAQDEVSKWWTVYRQSGGDAQNPQSIPRAIADPCN